MLNTSSSNPKTSSNCNFKPESRCRGFPVADDEVDPLLRHRAIGGLDAGILSWRSSHAWVQKSTTWPRVFRASERRITSVSKKHWKSLWRKELAASRGLVVRAVSNRAGGLTYQAWAAV